MKNVKRGDIYYISKNPYRPAHGRVLNSRTDHEMRPAIIVSNDKHNQNAFFFEVVYLTTTPKVDIPTHCTIRSANRVSTAICEQITTVSDEQIGDYMATCTAEEMRAVDACMAISLGIDPGSHKEATSKDMQIGQLTMDLIKAQKGEETYKAAYETVLRNLLDLLEK